MKTLALTCAFLSLVACGAKKDSSNDPGIERYSCGGKKSSLCIPQHEVEIVSSALPDQVMVIFEIGDRIVDVIDECMQGEYQMGTVTRGAQNDLINFEIYGGLALGDARITIFDRGFECDDEEIFFEADVLPTYQRVPGKSSKTIYTLNN